MDFWLNTLLMFFSGLAMLTSNPDDVIFDIYSHITIIQVIILYLAITFDDSKLLNYTAAITGMLEFPTFLFVIFLPFDSYLQIIRIQDSNLMAFLVVSFSIETFLIITSIFFFVIYVFTNNTPNMKFWRKIFYILSVQPFLIHITQLIITNNFEIAAAIVKIISLFLVFA